MNLENQNQLLEHLKAGYENSQQVVKAMDTKAGIISGFSVLLGTAMFSVAKWIFANREVFAFDVPNDFLKSLLAITAFISFGGVLVSLICNILSVYGRWNSSSFHILFPAYLPSRKEYAHQILYDKDSSLLSFHINEYRQQIEIMGGIIRNKIYYTGIACKGLLFSLVAFPVFLVLMACCTVLIEDSQPGSNLMSLAELLQMP